MCRLVAYLGAPLSPKQLVFDGQHSLYEQSWKPQELLSGSVNADGYGVVWYSEGVPGRIVSERPIWQDPDLPGTLGALRSGCVLAALRNTTSGLPVDRSGLLPMVFGDWTFVLNGFVPDFRRFHMRALRQELPDDLYAALTGVSDSETLFLMAVDELRSGATLRQALERVSARVRERVGRDQECQLNMILSDGGALAAVRSGTQLVTNSLYLAERPPFAPEGIVLASEPLDPGAAWSAVDGHSSLEILPDGTVHSDVLI